MEFSITFLTNSLYAYGEGPYKPTGKGYMPTGNPYKPTGKGLYTYGKPL